MINRPNDFLQNDKLKVVTSPNFIWLPCVRFVEMPGGVGAVAKRPLPKAVLKGRFGGKHEGAVPVREIIEPVPAPAGRAVTVSVLVVRGERCRTLSHLSVSRVISIMRWLMFPILGQNSNLNLSFLPSPSSLLDHCTVSRS